MTWQEMLPPPRLQYHWKVVLVPQSKLYISELKPGLAKLKFSRRAFGLGDRAASTEAGLLNSTSAFERVYRNLSIRGFRSSANETLVVILHGVIIGFEPTYTRRLHSSGSRPFHADRDTWTSP